MQAPIRMTDWNKYRFFYFVARESSFSKAAHLLNACQPSLSRAVANLEGRLKIKLFNRVARGVTLTQEGKNLFEALKIVFHELSSFEERLSHSIHEPQGLLKVFISHSLSSFLITPHIAPFLGTHSKLELSLTCHDGEGNINCKDADAILGLFDEEAQDLEQKHLTTYKVGLYASEDYLQHHGTPQESLDLSSHKLTC